MLLKDLERGDRFVVSGLSDPEGLTHKVFIFHHLDGLFSYCTTEDRKDVVHWAWNTPVKKCEEL
jgi:hypothetical protein